MLEFLLKHGVDPGVSGNDEAYPVHYACQYEQIKCLRLLMEVGFPYNVVYRVQACRVQGIGK